MKCVYAKSNIYDEQFNETGFVEAYKNWFVNSNTLDLWNNWEAVVEQSVEQCVAECE